MLLTRRYVILATLASASASSIGRATKPPALEGQYLAPQADQAAAAAIIAGLPTSDHLVPDAQHIDPVFDKPANLDKVASFLETAFAGRPTFN